MSSQEVNFSAVTPQHSIITSTTSEDEIKINIEAPKDVESNIQQSENNQNLNIYEDSESENCAVRSESVIKSPSKVLFVSSSTPVIKVVDSSQEFSEKENSNEVKKSIGANVIAQTSIVQCASPQNLTSFLHSESIPHQPNPFLMTSSFPSNFVNTSPDYSDLNSDNSFSFAPPKLLTPFSSINLFETSTNFQRPSVLTAADSNTEVKLSETISSSKTFISLNKEDIGKIKTPAFIKNSLEKNTSNGSSSNKECDHFNNTEDAKSFFTFGQNLEDRVVFDANKTTATDLKAEINSTSDNLISFKDVTSFESQLKDNSSDSIKSDDSKGDNEVSFNSILKNGENSDGVFKRKYEVITGEEDEQNVLSIHGKLYAWDADKINWVEKGRGHLRLNDVIKKERLCSRLVMRTSGVLRVILNAHIVAGMKFELANDNCLRFTNVDGIYLIKANPKDIDQLNSAIEYRLREITKRVKIDDEPSAQEEDEEEEDEDKSASANDSI